MAGAVFICSTSYDISQRTHKPQFRQLVPAYQQLREIKARIKSGTFNFDEEFPDYRYKETLSAQQDKKEDKSEETCSDVFDKFLAHCEMRVAMDDMAFSTQDGYREILDGVFRPEIGNEPFEQVVYSRLAGIVSNHTKKKKTTT